MGRIGADISRQPRRVQMLLRGGLVFLSFGLGCVGGGLKPFLELALGSEQEDFLTMQRSGVSDFNT